MVNDYLRKPSALFSLALSLMALSVVAFHLALYGLAREADEGAAAHIWQLLIVCNVVAIGYFGVRWVPAAPGKAGRVLTLQLVALVAALAPVFLLGL